MLAKTAVERNACQMWEKKKFSQPNGPRGSKLAQQYHIHYACNIAIPCALLVAIDSLDKQTSTGNTFHIADVAPSSFSLCASSRLVLKKILSVHHPLL